MKHANRAVVIAVALSASIGLGVAPAVASTGSSSGSAKRVDLLDRCDPVSFNAAVGPGSCADVGQEFVTFDEFNEKLNPKDFGHEAWRFSASSLSIHAKDSIQVTNRGGEAHSFTETPQFGGGCVAPLNAALNLTADVRCPGLFAELMAPGATLTVSGLAPGTHKFFCIIHPFMRTTVKVEA